MKADSRPLPIWLKWFCRIFGILILLGLLAMIPSELIRIDFVHLIIKKSGANAISGEAWAAMLGHFVGLFLMACLGIWLVRKGWKKNSTGETQAGTPTGVQTAVAPAPVVFTQTKRKHWSSCNILYTAPGENRLWQFDAKSGTLNRETGSAAGLPLPDRYAAKSWASLYQPKLNVAWLPPENVFLRVIELPKSSFGETLSMVELQLEKLSPLPVTQIVWTLQVMVNSPADNLQTIMVVIVERRLVEEFLGKLEAQGYLADRLEVPMLDQLAVVSPAGEGAWIYPSWLNSQPAALVAWWFGGALRNLSLVVLPANGERAKSLQAQLAQFVWAGELEGWLTRPPEWHLVAEDAIAAEWEPWLREGLGEPVEVISPVPLPNLAASTARRATSASPDAALLPVEYATRYRQQFVDRLWLHGLMAVGVLYAIGVAIYFCATGVLGYQTAKVEQQATVISGSYTNTQQLLARFKVLKERQDLKYAALDCWKLVADLLPDGISLQRFSFGDGHKLTLSGTVTPDQISPITDFYDTLRKSKVNGEPMFKTIGGEQLSYRQNANQVSWNFSLELARASEEQP